MCLQRALSESAKGLEQSQKAVDRCKLALPVIDLQLLPSPRQTCSVLVRVPKPKSKPTLLKADPKKKTKNFRWDDEEMRRLQQLLDEAEQQHHMPLRSCTSRQWIPDRDPLERGL